MRYLLAVLVAVIFAGCEGMTYPDYPVASLAYDPALLGTWSVTLDHDKPPTIVVLEAREVPAMGGRLSHGHAPIARAEKVESQPAPSQPNAYTIRLSMPGDKPEVREFVAYLFRAGETELLGVQVAEQELAKSGLFGLVLPVHHVFRVTRSGGAIHIHLPSESIAWVPLVRLMDVADEPAPLPDEPAGNGMTITNSIDRLLAAYAKYAGREDFWDAEPLVFSRMIP